MAKTIFQYEIILLVKAKREALELTQDDIADALDVSRGYIGQVESPNHPSRYTLDQLNTLAILMKCSPREFIPQTAINKNYTIRVKKGS